MDLAALFERQPDSGEVPIDRGWRGRCPWLQTPQRRGRPAIIGAPPGVDPRERTPAPAHRLMDLAQLDVNGRSGGSAFFYHNSFIGARSSIRWNAAVGEGGFGVKVPRAPTIDPTEPLDPIAGARRRNNRTQRRKGPGNQCDRFTEHAGRGDGVRVSRGGSRAADIRKGPTTRRRLPDVGAEASQERALAVYP